VAHRLAGSDPAGRSAVGIRFLAFLDRGGPSVDAEVDIVVEPWLFPVQTRCLARFRAFCSRSWARPTHRPRRVHDLLVAASSVLSGGSGGILLCGGELPGEQQFNYTIGSAPRAAFEVEDRRRGLVDKSLVGGTRP
jgi:hypothetical protein